MPNVLSDICLVGHPFASIGMSEQLLSYIGALKSAGAPPKVFDIYKYAKREDERLAEYLRPFEVERPIAETLIFHMNGDEVVPAFKALEALDPAWRSKVRNTFIVPAWELPRYPVQWIEGLKQFDGVLGISNFVSQSLESALDQPIPFVGQSVQRHEPICAYRRQFGIRESAFVFLAFFDLTSFSSRKNPQAVLDFCKHLTREARYEDFQICLKMKAGSEAVESDVIKQYLDAAGNDHVVIVNENLDRLGQTNLLACCDAYLSLHRSEGFGRGIGEAMGLGKPVIATNWSGAVDLLDARSSFPIRYNLVEVEPDAYPFGDGQQWAEPDVSHAVEVGLSLMRDLEACRVVGRRARRYARQSHFDFPVAQRLEVALDDLLNI